MNLFIKRLFPAVVAVAFSLAGAAGVDAQSSRPARNVERRIDTINRQARDYERENMSRDQKATHHAETAKRSRQIRVEIEDDLNSLQTSYNSTVTALQSAAELRPGFAADTGRAVRKHAARLKNNLALPEPDDEDAKPEPPPDTDRKTLSALCRAIYELITNPMFEGPGSLDAKNGTKARHDLDAIIRLADRLQKEP